MQDKLKTQNALESPLTEYKTIAPAEWGHYTQRVGLIARKIGNYPLWTKDGKKKQTTLLQVLLFSLSILSTKTTYELSKYLDNYYVVFLFIYQTYY